MAQGNSIVRTSGVPTGRVSIFQFLPGAERAGLLSSALPGRERRGEMKRQGEIKRWNDIKTPERYEKNLSLSPALLALTVQMLPCCHDIFAQCDCESGGCGGSA